MYILDPVIWCIGTLLPVLLNSRAHVERERNQFCVVCIISVGCVFLHESTRISIADPDFACRLATDPVFEVSTHLDSVFVRATRPFVGQYRLSFPPGDIALPKDKRCPLVESLREPFRATSSAGKN